MGVFSFLFGGGEKKKEKPVTAKPAAAKPEKLQASIGAKTATAAGPAARVGVAPKRGVELTQLKLVYGVHVRAGASAKAYAAACRLASFYKEFGAKGLSEIYRTAADRHFGDWLAEVSLDRRRIVLNAVRRR